MSFPFSYACYRVAKWIENGGFHELIKYNTPRFLSEKRVSLCMRHFDKSQYVNSDMVRLTRYAIPTIFGYYLSKTVKVILKFYTLKKKKKKKKKTGMLKT
jgi:hypothetical protein